MPHTEYRDYVAELRDTLTLQRHASRSDGSAQITVCRNGYGYRSVEHFGAASRRHCWKGPLQGDHWSIDDSEQAEAEIQRFFALPRIVAYSDNVLAKDRDPLSRSHWEATIALIEFTFLTEDVAWRQKMLFAGFEDEVHADFSIAFEQDVIVNDHETGSHFFEWRMVQATDHKAGAADVEPAITLGVLPSTTINERPRGFWSRARLLTNPDYPAHDNHHP